MAEFYPSVPPPHEKGFYPAVPPPEFPPYPEKRNLREDALLWIRDHEKAALFILSAARELVAAGRRFGVKLLTERLRWQATIEAWKRDEYKINNNHVAYIARWLIDKDPAIATFITLRKAYY